LKTIDILRRARVSSDRLAALDHLLALGYSPERAERACSRYPQGERLVHNNSVADLIGKTLVRVKQHGKDAIDFVATTGEHWRMWYEPDCCAQAWIEDVVGDLDDLVGAPVVMAEVVSDSCTSSVEDCPDSHTWTFYKLATAKGYVTIRWYGSSNGYYGETASFARVDSR